MDPDRQYDQGLFDIFKDFKNKFNPAES